MIDWAISVVEPDGRDAWALLLGQTHDRAGYDALRARLARAGCKQLSPREYHGVIWPDTTCTVTVETVHGRPHVTQMHTGYARLIPTESLDLTPNYVEALGRGRLLFGILPAGTLPFLETDGAAWSASASRIAGELIADAVERRELVAGLARILDRPVPAPAGRPAGRPTGRM